jgi:recombination protein RecA
MSSDFNKMMSTIRKRTGSTTFTESVYGEISSYIDTGCMALNRIISGDIKGGIPQGRNVLFGGESGVGKSLIAAQIIKNALDSGFKHIFYLDSEGGGLKTFFENLGCDLSRIEHVLVNTVEETTAMVNKIYDSIIEHKKDNPEDQFLIILDSLGNLVTEKFYTDAIEKDKQVTDMGLRARACNGLMQSTTIPALKSDTTFIAINHVYDDPGSMFTQKIKSQSGGKKLAYVATVTIQCTKALQKAEKKDKGPDGGHYNGADLRFFTVKNRLVKPFVEAEMHIDFSKGIDKWDGLIEPAVNYGFIKQAGAWYEVPSYSDKKVQRGELLNNDEIWHTFLDEFNEASKKELAYSSVNQIDELNVSETEV